MWWPSEWEARVGLESTWKRFQSRALQQEPPPCTSVGRALWWTGRGPRPSCAHGSL